MSSFPWPVYLRPLKPKNAESWQVSVMTALQFKEGVNAPGIIPQKKQLLIHVVDGMAKARPEALFAEYPISATTYADGDLKITYDSLANAVNGVAWWLNRELGPGKDFETLAYIGPNDVRYNAMILGAVKAGYKVSASFEPRSPFPSSMLTEPCFPDSPDIPSQQHSCSCQHDQHLELQNIACSRSACTSIVSDSCCPSAPGAPSSKCKRATQHALPLLPFQQDIQRRLERAVSGFAYLWDNRLTKSDHIHPRFRGYLYEVHSP